ncbi:MAG: ferritin family protein [Candidatus Cloacimonetes bacterium]|jgi:rubrerythrin|nr:ferritin family protein [Candidatus Cloacimonadota bacterium]
MDRKELYTLALAQEIRSQRLYSALAQSFKHPANSALFKELTLLEETHETKLRQAFGAEFPEVEPDPLQLKEPELAGIDPSDPAQLLQYAISREEKAQNHYLAFAADADDEDMKKLLLDLAAEEDNHRSLLLTEQQRILGAVQWFDPSELNGFMDY